MITELKINTGKTEVMAFGANISPKLYASVESITFARQDADTGIVTSKEVPVQAIPDGMRRLLSSTLEEIENFAFEEDKTDG